MKRTKVWMVGGIFVGAVFTALVLRALPEDTAFGQVSKATPIQWEYKIIQDKQHTDPVNLQTKLNELGGGGWDCVATVTRNYYSGNSLATDVDVILKRPKQ